MNTEETNWAVLARIPDLNAHRSNAHDSEAMDSKLPASTGRLLSQALSFKLLAGAAFLLLLAAIVPFLFNKKGAPSDASPSMASAPPWHPGPIVAEADIPPVGNPTAARAATSPPTPAATPELLPPPPEVNLGLAPDTESDLPLMSRWPNPAHAIAEQMGVEQPRMGANQPMTIRTPVYQADTRAAYRPEAGAARYENTVEEPVIRKNHDHTRSSVY